jgi:penicillin-binding protein 1A
MKRIILALLSMMGIGVLAALAIIFYVIHTFSQDLPDYRQLAKYEPPISTRIHAADGQLVEEFATEKRVFVPIDSMPKRVVQAFLSAEDRNFYHHPGVDFIGIGRAIATNLQHAGQGRRLVGGSTITQQVAKNFLLGNEVSYKRKIREAIIAFRIEKTFTKNQILELYLNEIYLGKGRYGAAAAALGYFDKALDELTLAQLAYLAVLPKAPNNYQVEDHLNQAVARRNWILERMRDDGYISPEEMETAQKEPLVLHPQKIADNVDSHYFNEEIRRGLSARYGEKALYEGGLSVRATLNAEYQDLAAAALSAGIVRYDRRHGYRGPVSNIAPIDDTWQTKLAEVKKPAGMKRSWRTAVVLAVQAKQVDIGFDDGKKGFIALSEMTWARKANKDAKGLGYTMGPLITKPSDVLKVGDVILAKPMKAAQYNLMQVPKVQGAIVVMDPHTGRVLAMQGGFDYSLSVFNRATQAQRQPGSSFKPFVYLTALNNGFTPSTMVLDGPVEYSMGAGQGTWRPQNYERNFLGMIPLRRGLELSLNTVTIRLADKAGIRNVAETARKFHVFDNMPPYLAMALGSGETTLMRMVTGYSMFVNGGKDISPTFIDRIQDRHGATIYRHDMRPCPECSDRVPWNNQPIPLIPDTREQVTDPRTAYQIVSILQGVTQRGTAKLTFKNFERPIAGKTGTTNDYKDAWFIGFTPDLVVGAYIGFDEPRSLGKGETGGIASAPIVRAFLKVALKGQPAIPFRIPENVSLVKINPQTAQPTDPSDPLAIWEAYLPGTEPGEGMVSLSDQSLQTQYADPNAVNVPPADAAPDVGTGGLY